MLSLNPKLWVCRAKSLGVVSWIRQMVHRKTTELLSKQIIPPKEEANHACLTSSLVSPCQPVCLKVRKKEVVERSYELSFHVFPLLEIENTPIEV